MSMQYSIDNLIPETEGLSLLFEGTQSNIRQKIINQYASDSYSRNEGSGSSIIVSFNRTAVEIQESINSEHDITNALINEQFFVVDVFSYRAGEIQEEPYAAYLQSPNDLTFLSIAIEEFASKLKDCRIIIDPVSLLIIYNNQNYVLDFLQTLIARIRSRNHTLLLVADEGVLNDRQLALVESIVDGSIELRSQEDENQLKIKVKFLKNRSYKSGWVDVNS
ncbi:MAG: RAD55 family ATPase [Candidatus Kariarchaeaceae archaeon]